MLIDILIPANKFILKAMEALVFQTSIYALVAYLVYAFNMARNLKSNKSRDRKLSNEEMQREAVFNGVFWLPTIFLFVTLVFMYERKSNDEHS